jgi:hypothetical protein
MPPSQTRAIKPSRPRAMLVVSLILALFAIGIVLKGGAEYLLDPRKGPDSIGAKLLEEKVRATYDSSTIIRFDYYEANRGRLEQIEHWALKHLYQGAALEYLEKQRASWPDTIHSNVRVVGIQKVQFDKTYSTATLETVETWYVTDIRQRKLFAEDYRAHTITLELTTDGWVVTNDVGH